MDGDPGTRRYKWFRPRQAVRGSTQDQTANNYWTGALYNNSTGPSVLVVRDLRWFPLNHNIFYLTYYQGRLAGTNLPAQPYFPGDATPAGLVDWSDQGSTLGAYDYSFVQPSGRWVAWWPHDFPIAIVPPGWSFVGQSQAKGEDGTLSLVWEVVSIDELEYMYVL